MLIKPCPRCNKFIRYGKTYCPSCEDEVERQRLVNAVKRKRVYDREYNKRRNPKYTRFYASGDWKRMSRAKMDRAGYKCEVCGRIAAEVHHIKPIQTPEGWELRLEWTNLIALCTRCHNAAHDRWQPRKPRA